MKIRVRLKELRTTKGWSQQKTAEKAGLSIDTIRSIETGRAYPSLKTTVALKILFECETLDEIIDVAV